MRAWQLIPGLGVLASTALVPPADAQHLLPERIDLGRAAAARLVPQPPSATLVTTAELYVRTGLWSVGFAISGGVNGMYIDNLVCESAHDDDEVSFGLDCFYYVGAATKTLWITAGAIGAIVSASRGAQSRGCPASTARLRALGGALLGAVPGIVAAANGPGAQPGLITVTPVLSALGAVSAVARCRGPRYGVSPAR